MDTRKSPRQPIAACRLRAALKRHAGSRTKAAADLGCTPAHVRALVLRYTNEGHSLPPPPKAKLPVVKEAYYPTPQEIVAGMQEIRRRNGLPALDQLRVAKILADCV